MQFKCEKSAYSVCYFYKSAAEICIFCLTIYTRMFYNLSRGYSVT